jgi:hypothetical protein
MGRRGKRYAIGGKGRRKEPLGRPRRRSADNIKIDLGGTEYSVVDCIGLAQNRNKWRTLVAVVMNIRVA